jgi:hypothetical protein
LCIQWFHPRSDLERIENSKEARSESP